MYLASGSHMVLCFQIWHWPCSGTRKFYSKDSINHCIANSGCGLPWVLGTYILNHPIRKNATFSAFLLPPASFVPLPVGERTSCQRTVALYAGVAVWLGFLLICPATT